MSDIPLKKYRITCEYRTDDYPSEYIGRVAIEVSACSEEAAELAGNHLHSAHHQSHLSVDEVVEDLL